MSLLIAGGLDEMTLKVTSHPNHAMILCAALVFDLNVQAVQICAYVGFW